MRVLVKDQADQTQNGIYTVATSAWSRTKDFDGNTDFVKGTLISVAGGSINGDAIYGVTSSDPQSVGENSITFGQKFSSVDSIVSSSDYIQFPDGTMISWGSFGSNSSTDIFENSFPVSFASAPNVIGVPIRNGDTELANETRTAVLGDITTTGFRSQNWVFSTGTGLFNRSGVLGHYIAVGKWSA